ncbi:hypothetical protein DIPPA_19234 [Diplonema papillatum]|nr:hypothetical protein DIPPA_19234 [Diplonema papillatum]
MVVHEPEGKAIMFGGLGGDETTYGDPVLNDVWLFDVHTEAWSELRTYGEYPIPVFGHTAEIIDTDPANLSMLVFGGQSFGGTMASDTVVLFGVLSEYPFWRKLATQQAVNR